MTELKKELSELLANGAEKMNIGLSNAKIEALINYITEFDKWNKAYNLSAVRNIKKMVERHLLDSLSVIPYIKNSEHQITTMIDVGTGGGLPGIPLAIMFPDKKITLLDSNGKKSRFLFHIKTTLKLENINIENRRVEEYVPTQKFDAVISRAFASLEDMTEGCMHLIKSTGLLLAMKGTYPENELAAITDKVNILETIKLTVAATEGERHLLVLQPKK